MSIRSIRTFVQIEKLGSFSNAARALGMTQSTVSLQMKTLEEEMGVTLFDRTGRRPTLNARGRAFWTKAVELLIIYDQLGDVVGGYDELIGRLNIGSVNTIMTGILPDALATIRVQHPQLETRIIGGLSQDLMHKVDSGEIDAALVSAPPFKLDTNLSWSAICAEPLVVIAPVSLAKASYKELLNNHSFIRFNRHTWAGRLIDTELRRQKITICEGMNLDSLEAITLMVSRELGVSIVPQRTIATPFPASLYVVPFGEKPTYREIGMITRFNSDCSFLTDVFFEALSSTVKIPEVAILSHR